MTDHKAESFVDELATAIRCVDKNRSLGAGALAESLAPFIMRKHVEWLRVSLANLGRMPTAAPAASEAQAAAEDRILSSHCQQPGDPARGRRPVCDGKAGACGRRRNQAEGRGSPR